MNENLKIKIKQYLYKKNWFSERAVYQDNTNPDGDKLIYKYKSEGKYYYTPVTRHELLGFVWYTQDNPYIYIPFPNRLDNGKESTSYIDSFPIKRNANPPSMKINCY